ncbi:SDR family NAD(P)-dependent oxidoreductase [Streptomyces lydicus]|uniref:SDR family NAD(P)-dependent oxidoreductase n=1 Tax=Streptomyces lydicus TaxID=47763 RepID=UPI0013E966D8|nr:SDR family oxidoreductase [Streptomyces lydicus]MCZ1012154.1 SDR family oxidoreductase [Streptomyces lydicus]
MTLVVGGSSGTGAAIVRRLHTDGHRILATYYQHPERADALAAGLDPARRRLAFVPADLADPDGPEDLVRQAVSRYGRLDSVVHCAADIDTTQLAELTAAGFDRVLHTNVTAAFLLLRAAAAQPAMRAAVVISSIAATFTGPDSAAYESSKAATSMLTRSLAAAYAPRVRINAVAPGAVETERSLADPGFPRAMLQGRIPLGRLAEPADVAAVAAFLLGPDAAYLTGQVITVDGGLSLKLT